MSSFLQRLKPTYHEILELALRETDPAEAASFEAISRGPIFAVAAIVGVLILALPQCLVRLLGAARRGLRVTNSDAF